MISVSGLNMNFKKKTVLEHIDLKIGQGEVFGLTGINGSGKSVFMKILATLLSPTGGKVSISGYDIEKNRNKVRALIGYMPDSAGFDDRLSVKEYLNFFKTMYQESRGDGLSIEQLLDAIGSTLSDRSISELSRGSKQMISLTRAVVHNPSVLLLDGPDTGVDWDGQERMLSLLKTLCDKGKTIIIASHSIPFLKSVSNRIGVIHGGRLMWTFPAGVESPESIRAKIKTFEGQKREDR